MRILSELSCQDRGPGWTGAIWIILAALSNDGGGATGAVCRRILATCVLSCEEMLLLFCEGKFMAAAASFDGHGPP